MEGKAAAVSQLDAAAFDSEIVSILLAKLQQAYQWVTPTFPTRYKPELKASLRMLLYALTILRRNNTASPGMRMFGLEFRGKSTQSADYQTAPPYALGSKRNNIGTLLTRRRKLLLVGVLVLVPYCYERLGHTILNRGWEFEPEGSWAQRVARWYRSLQRLEKAASLAHFLLFLYAGQYRSLLERMCGAHVVYTGASGHARMLDYSLMNQEMLWAFLGESVSFLNSLVDFDAVFSSLATLWQRGSAVVSRWVGKTNEGGAPAEDGSTVLGAACPYCGVEKVVVPVRATPCRHISCYYCLASRMVCKVVSCARCGQRVRGLKGVSGGS